MLHFTRRPSRGPIKVLYDKPVTATALWEHRHRHPQKDTLLGRT